jgi:prepilin-type processing-associated H-X9-DG protein
MYATEWNGFLPGNHRDWTGMPSSPSTITTFCWLGTWPGNGNDHGDDPNWVPRKGTVFRYVGENDKVYKCPEDKLDSKIYDPNHSPPMRNKVLYSYTSPDVISGAPLPLLDRTLFPMDFPLNYSPDVQWKDYVRTTLPWMMVEEDERNYLNFVTDAAWGNADRLTTRHGGKASVAHTDGSVTNRKYQNSTDHDNAWAPGAMNANMVYYELTDGRRISVGYYGYKMGEIWKAGDLGH